MKDPVDTPALVERLQAVARQAEQSARACSRVSRQLARAATDEGAGDLKALRGLTGALGVVREAVVGLAPALEEAARLAQEAVAGRERTLRLDVMSALKDGLKGHGVAGRLISETPCEVRADPLTIELDFEKLEARICYARLPIERGVALEPSAIVARWADAARRLGGEGTPMERFREALALAYRLVLARQGRPAGERVDLVDLWVEVALRLQGERFCREPSRGSFKDYPRWRFAHDLARLRSEGGLVLGEHRVSIGAATAGSTAAKQRVLWIEDASGGQYYLTFHLVRQTSGAATAGGGPP